MSKDICLHKPLFMMTSSKFLTRQKLILSCLERHSGLILRIHKILQNIDTELKYLI